MYTCQSPSLSHPPVFSTWYHVCVSISALQTSSSLPVFFPGGSGNEESAQMQESWVQSLGWEDPLEKGIPLQYSCLENSMDREPGGLQSVGSQGVGHD